MVFSLFDLMIEVPLIADTMLKMTPLVVVSSLRSVYALIYLTVRFSFTLILVIFYMCIYNRILMFHKLILTKTINADEQMINT